jgi:hypothetical protein
MAAICIVDDAMMEGFAGTPNPANPAGWKSLSSSCHACHATASWNPETNTGNKIPKPVGKLPAKRVADLEKGSFMSVDFIWPIVFNAK